MLIQLDTFSWELFFPFFTHIFNKQAGKELQEPRKCRDCSVREKHKNKNKDNENDKVNSFADNELRDEVSFALQTALIGKADTKAS